GPRTDQARSTKNQGPSLFRERIGAQLEVRRERLRAFSAFDQPRRTIAVGGPQAAAFPARLRIVDAAVESLGIEAERIWHAQHHHAPVRVGDDAVVQISGGHRHVVTEPERVVLIDPRVVARLGAVLANALESGTRILMERPALRAVIARRLRTVERRFALAPIEAADVSAAE